MNDEMTKSKVLHDLCLSRLLFLAALHDLWDPSSPTRD